MTSAILGGTFSVLHAGHRQLLVRARPYSKIYIGLTTDALARQMGHHDCPPARIRLRRLKAELRRLGMLRRCQIFPITDRHGPAVTLADLQAIIVSPETEPVAQRINRTRVRRRLGALNVVVVPHVLAADGLPISATRIKAGIIDPKGRRLAPLRIAVGSDNPTKLAGARAAFAKAFPRMKWQVRGFKVGSGVHEQPVGFAQTWLGASNRARIALARWPQAEYAVGLESGLIPFGKKHFDIQFCALTDGTTLTAGSSMGFPIPPRVEARVFHKKTEAGRRSMGDVLSALSSIPSIGRKGGAIAYLSGGLLQRQAMTEQAVLCAFVERRSPL